MPHPLSYTMLRNSIAKNAKKLTILNDEHLNSKMQMVSAALTNYLPSVAVQKHESIFKEIVLHNKLSVLEQSSFEALEAVQTENLTDETLTLLKTKPVIICTFHTGSYRLLNLLLLKQNVPFSLVMGKEVAEKEGGHFKELYQEMNGNAKEDFKIIDAENTTAGLQMLRELKRGRSLVLYMDGNTGAGVATTKNDNRCVLNFLNQQIFARKGIAFLAHAANIPIVTVVSYRQSLEAIRLKFFNPIFPDLSMDRNLFAERTTQEIYKMVEPVIKKYPGQWEGWMYIHKVANIVNLSYHQPVPNPGIKTEKVILNSYLFGIFKINGNPFLLKKNTYSFYEINNCLYEALLKCTNGPTDKNSIEDKFFNQLYDQGVVKYI